MEYWVIMESGHCLGLVVAPAEWDEMKVLAAWANPRNRAASVAAGELYAEKWQIETLKE